VTNVGIRPTFDEALPRPVVEAHLLDWDGDLYDQTIGLAFVARLREERRFPNKEALVEQIQQDIRIARSARFGERRRPLDARSPPGR
jgi:riboflavin kinase/FMN adenylyltransferase